MNFNKHTVTPTFATSFIFDNFIPTYHSLHVCSCQALLCARLAACHVPLVIVLQVHSIKSSRLSPVFFLCIMLGRRLVRRLIIVSAGKGRV